MAQAPEVPTDTALTPLESPAIGTGVAVEFTTGPLPQHSTAPPETTAHAMAPPPPTGDKGP